MELRSDLMALCMASLYIQFIRSQHEVEGIKPAEKNSFIIIAFSLRKKQFRLMNEIVIEGNYLPACVHF
jgi:hypothetical protein